MAPIASGKFGFNDGNTGHVCNLGSTPSVGQWDVLCVNSNTVVSTPAGFTAAEVAVTNQGTYIFVREAVGGEGSTVTVTTSGNHDTQVSWSRWPASLVAVDTSTNTELNSSVGGSTPAHSTGGLAATGELAIAFGALHSIQSANQSAPSWGSYTAIDDSVQGSGGSGVRGYTAYRENVGTAAETPQVSWSGDGCFNRYMLVVTFTVSAAAPVDGALAATLPALTASLAGVESIPGAFAATLPVLRAAFAGGPPGGAVVLRPNLGIVERPFTGTVTRP